MPTVTNGRDSSHTKEVRADRERDSDIYDDRCSIRHGNALRVDGLAVVAEDLERVSAGEDMRQLEGSRDVQIGVVGPELCAVRLACRRDQPRTNTFVVF